MDGDLITVIGLLLTQLRYARRALEDIERSTARYGSFAFTSALSEGPRFGAPPMLSGALKVHIVNINELAPGSGFGGFLESLLGGVGRFFGGLIGSFVGGTVGGFNVPGIIAGMNKLAERIERILTLLGVDLRNDKTDKTDKDKKEGPGLIQRLKELTPFIDLITNLLGAGGNKSKDQKGPGPVPDPLWLPLMQQADALVRSIANAVQGLTFMIPLLIGALAWVVTHLRNIQLAALELVQFLVKELLLLRGVVLFTVEDTLAGAAHLAANILSTLGKALPDVIDALTKVFEGIFNAGIKVLEFLATGIKETVDSVMTWLFKTIGAVLMAIGDTKVFRVVTHLIQVLPALLPGLVLLVRNTNVPNLDALSQAAAASVAGPSVTGTSGAPPAPPPFPDLLGPAKDKLEKSSDTLTKALTQAQTDLKTAFDTSIGALNNIGSTLDAVKTDKSFLDALDGKEAEIRKHAEKFAGLLDTPISQLEKQQPDSGLKKIADAYEAWLSGGGMSQIFDSFKDYIAKSPSAAAAFAPPQSQGDSRPPATVEIQEVLIDLGTASDATGKSPPDARSDSPGLEAPELLSEHEEELDLLARCPTPVPGAAITWGYSRRARYA